MNIPTHTSNVIKSLNFLISISFKFRTIFFNYYTPILMKKQSRVYLLIIEFIAIIKSHQPTKELNQPSIIRVNRSETKYCVLHNGITWNYLPDVFKVNLSFSAFKNSQGTKILSGKIFVNVDAERHSDDMTCIYCLSSVIALG